jgi:hypothetical protein
MPETSSPSTGEDTETWVGAAALVGVGEGGAAGEIIAVHPLQAALGTPAKAGVPSYAILARQGRGAMISPLASTASRV